MSEQGKERNDGYFNVGKMLGMPNMDLTDENVNKIEDKDNFSRKSS